MMKELTLDSGKGDASNGAAVFGGFIQQRELLKEVIELKINNKEGKKVRIKVKIYY